MVVAGTLTTFLAACSEGVWMHPKDVIEQHEFHEHMRVRLNNGKTYDTERMTVTQTTVTIYELKGSAELDQPIVIPMNDVDTIERFQYDASNSAATAVTIGLFASAVVFVVAVTRGFGHW